MATDAQSPEFTEFVTAVSNMRLAQKKYFARRSPSALDDAKAAEAEVDRMLKSLAPTNVAVRANQAMQTSLDLT